MTNFEIKTLTGVIKQTHQVVYDAALRGDRGEAYEDYLARLGQAVAEGTSLLHAAQGSIKGSTARVGERPPRGVYVDTWRAFVRALTAARSTWYNEARARAVRSGR